MTAFLKAVGVLGIIVVVYFFSFQIQKVLAKGGSKIAKVVGTWSVSREYSLQRYIFIHPDSIISSVYNWVNEQIIALGLKRYGITPVGFSSFWCIISGVLTVLTWWLMNLGMFLLVPLYIVTTILVFTLTRVYVSNKILSRELEIMDAEDLIIPEIKSGVQNAIIRYIDNFSPALQPDFRAFVTNITDRGYSFNDAMYILADSLGVTFKDFAQKAIFYEAAGEDDMVDIFTDIVETNRLRRELRTENEAIFTQLTTSFVVSTVIVALFGAYMITTDEFTYNFFFNNEVGKVIFLSMFGIVLGVLSYITTLKSKAL